MPASLRFATGLFLAALLVAALSLFVLDRQKDTRARILAEQATLGHAKGGEAALRRYGCGSCHEIPGLSDAKGKVGPSLDGVAGRSEIAGLLANQPTDLIRWIREPQAVSPGSGMPNLGVTEAEARDIAAYLYTLD